MCTSAHLSLAPACPHQSNRRGHLGIDGRQYTSRLCPLRPRPAWHSIPAWGLAPRRLRRGMPVPRSDTAHDTLAARLVHPLRSDTARGMPALQSGSTHVESGPSSQSRLRPCTWRAFARLALVRAHGDPLPASPWSTCLGLSGFAHSCPSLRIARLHQHGSGTLGAPACSSKSRYREGLDGNPTCKV